MAKNRSLRLRKKLRIGEFQELGFTWEASFKLPLSPDQAEALVDALIVEAIEPGDLAFGGWANGGVVTPLRRGSVSESQRLAVLSWLRARKEIADVRASALFDVWHSDNDDDTF
jgi:hypothetical protein